LQPALGKTFSFPFLHDVVRLYGKVLSLASGLFLTCAQSSVDRSLLCGRTVCYGSAIQSNSAFHPSGVNKLVHVFHVITWITEVETIKRHTRATYGCMAAGQSPWAQAVGTA